MRKLLTTFLFVSLAILLVISPAIRDNVLLGKDTMSKEDLAKLMKEIEEFNKKMGFDTSMPINGRRLTNLGIFRKYLESYLKENPSISSEATQMVRQLQPTERGIPVEIYCFSAEKAWVIYEGVQADLFDHVLASVTQFELRIFQNPSGVDFQKLIPNT